MKINVLGGLGGAIGSKGVGIGMYVIREQFKLKYND